MCPRKEVKEHIKHEHRKQLWIEKNTLTIVWTKKDTQMATMQVKAGEKCLEELGAEQQGAVWEYLKGAKYSKLKIFLLHAGCTRQTGQRLMDKLVQYGILEEQSSYWKTSAKWRAKWAFERANEKLEEDQEEESKELTPPPKTAQSLKPGPVAQQILESAEQEGEEPPESLKPSPARKKKSNTRRKRS